MAYRRTERVIARLAARHDAIVAAARALAGENGMSAVQIVPVAERAGIASGTVYRYFPSKEDLVAALVAATAEQEIAAIRDAVTAAPGPLSALASAIMAFAGRALRERRLASAMLAGPADGDAAGLRAWRSVGRLREEQARSHPHCHRDRPSPRPGCRLRGRRRNRRRGRGARRRIVRCGGDCGSASWRCPDAHPVRPAGARRRRRPRPRARGAGGRGAFLKGPSAALNASSGQAPSWSGGCCASCRRARIHAGASGRSRPSR